MTLILSGTDGVSDIDGTAATPAIRGTDANTGIFFPAADTIAFAEGGAEAMRIDSSGNVGIGTSSPNIYSGATYKRITLSDSANAGYGILTVAGGSGGGGEIDFGNQTIRQAAIATLDGSILGFYTNATNSGSVLSERMRIDSSGNVGIGATSPSYRLDVSKTTAGDVARFTNAAASNKSLFVYTDAQYAAIATGTSASGNGIAFDATNNSILFTTASQNRAIINSSGNVGIGTTSPVAGWAMTIQGLGSGSTSQLVLKREGSDQGVEIQAGGGTFNFTPYDGSNSVYPQYVFNQKKGSTTREVGTFTQQGFFKASNDGSYYSSTGTYHEMSSDAATNVVIFRNENAGPYGPWIYFSGATPNNTTNYFLAGADTTNDKFFIYSNGTIANRTGLYTSISDLKLKQDVVDANSQWNDIKALRIVKYRLKDEVAADPNYPAYIGVIAQEVEQVSPGLVYNCPDFENVTKTREVEKTREVTPAVLDDEGNEVTPAVTETYTETEEYTERVATGTVTKSVKSSIIYMKAVKALQEAMTRIETLEAQNAAFEARLAALENK